MEGNFEWFLEHYNDIYVLLGECYIVIEKQKIIKVFSTETEAYRWVENHGMLGKCNIQYCNGNESAYTTYDFTILTNS